MNSDSSKAIRTDVNTMLKGSDGKGEVSMAERLAMNALAYDFDKSFPAIRSRTMYVNDANKSLYLPSETALTYINSGSQFIYGPGCTLQFDFKYTGAQPGAFNRAATIGVSGNSSGANCLRSIVITSASGQELERVEGLALILAYAYKYQVPHGAHGHNGSSFYYEDASTMANNDYRQVSIPMYLISGLFGSKKLLPPQCLAGARIEFGFNTALDTVVTHTADPSYEIHNLRIWTDAVHLEDAVLLEVQKRAAKEGLSLSFNTWDRSQFSTSATGANTFSANKAVSRAIRAVAICRKQQGDYKDAGGNAITFRACDENSAGELCPVSKYQWRLGDMYYPNAPVSTYGNSVATRYYFTEMFNHVVRGWDRFSSQDLEVGTDLFQFYGTLPTAGIESVQATSGGDSFCFAVNLERSPTVDNAGVPISSSRVLEFMPTLVGAGSRRVDIFLQYQRALLIGLDRIVVRM